MAHPSPRVALDLEVARTFVDMPLQWYHGGVRVDRAAVAAALVAVERGSEREADVSHHRFGERADAGWHSRRIAYFIRRPERIGGVLLHIGSAGDARVDDGRHRYAAALYLGLRRIPNCRVVGPGAPLYHARAAARAAGEAGRP